MFFYFLAALRSRHRGSMYCNRPKNSTSNFWWIYTFYDPTSPKKWFFYVRVYVCVSVCLSVGLCTLISQDLLNRLGWNFVSGSFSWIQLGVFFIFEKCLFFRVATLQKKVVSRIFSKTAPTIFLIFCTLNTRQKTNILVYRSYPGKL